MYATDFIFDEVNLSSKGYMVCTFDGDSIVSGGEIEPIVKKTPNADEYTYYTAQINNVLTWELGICKLPCGTEAFEPLNQYEESELAQFLLKTDGYRWLQFVQPDDYPDVFYKVYINMTPYQIGGQTFGYNLTITSNCGYGFSHEYTATLTDDNQPLTINVNNDLNRYIYPTVSFETNADECWIYNENDLEQNLGNGKESHFYNLGDNVDVLKEISMDSTNDVINGIETSDQFNWNFLRLVNGENNIYADGILADEHYSTTEWETVRDGATLTKNGSHTFYLKSVRPDNGITAHTAFDYELHYDSSISYGSTNAGSNITLPNTSNIELKTKLKKLIFDLEQEYNYVYLYAVNPYQIELYGTIGTLVYRSDDTLFQFAPQIGFQPFDCYTVNIDYITGEISSVTKTYESKTDRTSIENFLYVPVAIRKVMIQPPIVIIPVKTDYIPEIMNARRIAPLFELDGLPDDYKTEEDFYNLTSVEGKGVLVLRTDTDEYEIWESDSNQFEYYFHSSGEYLMLNAPDHSELKIYSYDKTTKTWSLTHRNAGEHLTYDAQMGINGFLGDVVYVSENAELSPKDIYVIGGGFIYDFENKWEIYTGGEFIENGNDENVYSTRMTSGVYTFEINLGLERNRIDYSFFTRYDLNSDSFDGQFDDAYFYNSSNYDVEFMLVDAADERVILQPHTAAFISGNHNFVTNPPSDGALFVYEPRRHATSIPSRSSVCFPIEDAILTSDHVSAVATGGGSSVALSISNIDRQYSVTCEITGATQNIVAIEYEKYLPIESQQNATIKYREIRRVLV